MEGKMKSFGALCLSLMLVSTVFAQPEKAISNKDTYNWMFGASWTLTDDDGDAPVPVGRAVRGGQLAHRVRPRAVARRRVAFLRRARRHPTHVRAT